VQSLGDGQGDRGKDLSEFEFRSEAKMAHLEHAMANLFLQSAALPTAFPNGRML
jgi:hypothetical protein